MQNSLSCIWKPWRRSVVTARRWLIGTASPSAQVTSMPADVPPPLEESPATRSPSATSDAGGASIRTSAPKSKNSNVAVPSSSSREIRRTTPSSATQTSTEVFDEHSSFAASQSTTSLYRTVLSPRTSSSPTRSVSLLALRSSRSSFCGDRVASDVSSSTPPSNLTHFSLVPV